MPASASPVGIKFQTALADSARRASDGPKAQTLTCAAGRATSKQDKAQAPTTIKSDDASANVTVPPTEQKTEPLPSPTVAQGTENPVSDRPATVSALTPDIQPLSASPDRSWQASVQAVSAAAEPVATMMQQPSAVDGSDPGEDKATWADAKTVAEAVTLAGTGVAAQATGETLKLQIEMPMATAGANKANSVQSVGKESQKNIGGATPTKSADATNSADAEKTKGAETVGAVAGTSSHSAQSDGQPMQHSHPDASQAAVVQKVLDGNAQQVQASPMHAAIHQAATPGAPNGLLDATRSGVMPRGAAESPLGDDEPTATSGINASRLIQTMSETGMRVGMHSAEFGNISIRTSVSQQQMLAQISLDHNDLGQAISGHISSMQTKLGNDSGLQTVIQVNHQGAPASGEQGSARREQQAFAPSVRREIAAAPAELDVGMHVGLLAGGARDGYRLDIRA